MTAFFGCVGFIELKLTRDRTAAQKTWLYGAFVVVGGAIFAVLKQYF
jgi:hypothetical protein